MGDDCAVLAPARGRELLTIDPVIAGVHFDGKVSPGDAGSKLVKRNLSDIAAMGGAPRAAVIALALDPRVSVAWLEAFMKGAARESRRYHVPIVGGDVASLPGGFVATLALTGEAAGRAVTRTGARAGDWIYVTGVLGRSLATGHHHAFQPRLAEGAWLAGRREVRSMMDVSDGLAKDLASLAPRGCVPALVEGAVPRRKGASLKEALGDGEDYELVFTLDKGAGRADFETAWGRAFPSVRLSRIGSFVAVGAPPDGAVRLSDLKGYEHLRQA
jgi:thiamine-monophosphate kinase